MSDASRPTAADDSAERKEQYLARVSHVQMGLAPKNFEEGLRMAELLARSTLVPQEFRGNAGNVLIAIQMAMEIGLPPMQALQSICVINGRPSIWGDGLLALVQSSTPFEWIDEPPVENGVATCTVKRKGWPNPVSRTFSVDDAKKAGLWNKSGPWQNYPERMLRMRARAFALRDVFADVLRGLASAEEMLDVAPQAAIVETKPDPLVIMRNDLQCSDAQWAEVLELWDALKVAPAQRIVQAKKYAGRAGDLIGLLIDMGAPLPVPSSIAAPEPVVVTKHAKKRMAKAKAEGTKAPEPDPGIAESIADALGKEENTCEHGVDLQAPCEACKALAAELDAEAAAQTSTVKSFKLAPPDVEPF